MSIKVPVKIIGIQDPDKASKANEHASRASNVKTLEGVKTSMGKGTDIGQKSGKSAKGK